jgi:AraC-like DNA-binding protein
MSELLAQPQNWNVPQTFNGLRTYRPSPLLTRYVEYFWTLRSHEDGVSTLKLLANGASGIIVQHHNGGPALNRTGGTPSPGGHDIPSVFVYGKRTQPGELVARGPFELSGVVFRPQALHALLDTDPTEFNNGPVNLDYLLGGLEERLLNAATARDRLAILACRLSTRASDKPSDDLLARESVRLLQARVHIPQLLKVFGMSERQFERRFRTAVGVSPHLYLRIQRFQSAVRLLRARQFEKMGDLAAALGYADQSHFIKEIKEFAGCTPTVLSEIVRASIKIPCAWILSSPLSSPGC